MVRLHRRGFLAGGLCVAGSACTPLLSAPSGRRVERVLAGVATTDGAGVSLTRIIGRGGLQHLDPFIMLDRFHSDEPNAYIRGFPDHPHRGFETITVMLQGRMRHKDSRGNHGVIGPGGIQWMTAGRGIVHSEMPEQNEGWLSGFQLWLNLPAREKMRVQEYQDLAAGRIAEVGLGSGGRARVISGRVLDTRGPVAARSTEPILLTATLADDRPLVLDVPREHAAFVFVSAGSLAVDDADRVEAGNLAVLTAGDRVRLRADRTETAILFAAAKPIREPIVQRGPFVMNTEEEIRRAFDDYRRGTLAL